VIAADEKKTIVVVDLAVGRLRQPDVVVDPLVRNDTPDEKDVDQAIAEDLFEGWPPRRRRNPFSVDGNWHHACLQEPKAFQLLPIELGVAERKINVPHKRSQLLTANRCEPEKTCVVGGEEGRRRDVVILKHASAAECRERLGHRRGEREMKNRDVATARIRIAERAHISAKRIIHRQRKQIGRMSCRAQHAADTPGAVADRIPLVSGGDPLIDDHGRGWRLAVGGWRLVDCCSPWIDSVCSSFANRQSPAANRGSSGSALYNAGLNW